MPEPTHLEHGHPVVVLIKPYQRRKDLPERRFPCPAIGDYAPVNVLIERADGSRVVRPRRGLRRIDA